ncbi:MAG: hypothetical protein FD147_1562 [Chloroflexi bacterium]|nr:MAG: hypothetical protein FD147_1562 [Chloroflexota bacterium]
MFKEHGGYLCSAEEKKRLHAGMWPDGAHLNKEVVGQHASKIAKLAGIADWEKVKFLMVVGEAVGKEDMFSGKKLSPCSPCGNTMSLMKRSNWFATSPATAVRAFLWHSHHQRRTHPEARNPG